MNNLVLDEDSLARNVGYRNFRSFVFCNYFGEEKKSIEKCAKILNISGSKMRSLLLENGWKPRSRKQAVRPKPKKRRMFLHQKVKKNTPFIFPWCAMYVYYCKYELTTYEISNVVGISQTSVCKVLKKYKIKRRKKGVTIGNS